MATKTAARWMSHSAPLRIPAHAQPGDVLPPFHGKHFGGVQHNDVGCSTQPSSHATRCAQSRPVVDEGHAARQSRKKQSFFHGRVTAADDGDLAAGEVVSIVFGAGADSTVFQLTRAGDVEGPVDLRPLRGSAHRRDVVHR